MSTTKTRPCADALLAEAHRAFPDLYAARRAVHRAEGRLYAHALDVMRFYKTTPGANIDADIRDGNRGTNPKRFAHDRDPMASKVVELINDNVGQKFNLGDLDPDILSGMYKYTRGASSPKSREELAKKAAAMRGVEAVLKFWDEWYEADETPDVPDVPDVQAA